MNLQEVRRTAEHLFVREVKTLDEIALQTGFSRRTLARWSSKADWMRKRLEWQYESPRAALDILKKQRQFHMDAVGKKAAATPEALEALNKITLLVERLESHVEAIGPMLDTLERFAQFVGARAESEECAVLYKWTEQFLDEQRRKHS
ncbi:MAG: hypothetical protein ABSA67_14325 [Candidatus Brocadiia bacterium]|jgi:hypothetical protein